MVSTKFRTSLTLLLLALAPCLMLADTSSRVFSNFNAANGLADNSAQTIKCTKTGRLVITTMGQINFFDGQKFSYIDPTEENIYPLSDYLGNYHLYFDKYHHLWLKDKKSITCVDLITEKFALSIADIFKEFGMEKDVSDLFVSSDGIVWLLNPDGIFSVELKKNFKIRRDLNLQDLDVIQDKYLMLFFENGLLEVLDLSTGKKKHESYAYGKEDIKNYNKSSVLHFDSTYCYQLRNGDKESVLLRLDLQNWEWKTITRMSYHLNNIAQKDSLLYLPSEYGYWIYNTANEKLVHIDKLRLANGQELETDVNVIAFDRQGGLWAGTESRGLLYSKPYNSPFNVYHWSDKRTGPYYQMMADLPTSATFQKRPVNCVYRDSRGWTWVGTTKGLQLYKKASDHLPKVITQSDGLLNNVIHSIVEDHQHHIWISTSYGISCLVINHGEIDFINSYNKYDNIPEETFVNGHAICKPDGEIVMQSLDHVITFNPGTMMTIHYDFPFELYPKLTKVLVNGNDIKTGMEVDGQVILEKALGRTSEINLNYNQNSLTLTFSALNYFRPQQTFYRLRVKGVIDDWRVFTSYNSHGMVDSRGQFHLPLMNLKPGSYVIELQASMTPDKWNTTPYEWVINVNEPWWRTTGVLMLYLLFLLILVAVNAYYYIKNANLRALRNSGEQTLIKRIRNFAEHCSIRASELLEPMPEEVTRQTIDPSNVLSDDFVVTMEKIMPYVLSKDVSKLTMRDLSAEAGVDIQEFYNIISSNIYKSPHPMARKLMLRKAQHLLETTQKDIHEISEECGFVTPNYFIASFYRVHQMTPAEYRSRQ